MDVFQAEAIIHEHLKARGIAMPPPPSMPDRIHPTARRLSELLYDERIREIDRIWLRAIVQMLMADRRRS